MTDQAWMKAAVAMWRGVVTGGPGRWQPRHDAMLAGWAKRIVRRPDRDAIAHNVATVGIFAAAGPGDPLPEYRKRVKVLLDELPASPLTCLTRHRSDDRGKTGPRDGVGRDRAAAGL